MTEFPPDPFVLGLTYWPRRRAFAWWSSFDRAEVREELAHVAALGCTHVRLCLRWEDIQPAPQRINSAMMRAFEQALDAAAEAGLSVVTALFPVTLGWALHLPLWANQLDPFDELKQLTHFGARLRERAPGLPYVITEWRYQPNQARDLFSEPALLAAQRYQLREVVGYFGTHPAVWAWQLGEGLEWVRRPTAEEAVVEWFDELSEAVREQPGVGQVLGLTSRRGLTLRAGPRPEQLVGTCDLVGVSVDLPPLISERRPLDRDAPSLYHGLTATLSRRPTLVFGLGQPTTPNRGAWIAVSAYGRRVPVYLATLTEQADYLGAVLDRLHSEGARGVFLAAYADYPTTLWGRPPLDRVARERTLGLIDADGREKPAAAVVRAFAAKKPTAVKSVASLAIDEERYWHDPRRGWPALWREITGAPRSS